MDRATAEGLRDDCQGGPELRAVLLPAAADERELSMVVSERRVSVPNNPITGVLLAIPGYFLGVWLGTLFGLADDQNTGVILGYVFAASLFLIGGGLLNYPLERVFAWRVSASRAPAENQGVGRFFRLSLDHKVIGI